jgi:hypothetical protein
MVDVGDDGDISNIVSAVVRGAQLSHGVLVSFTEKKDARTVGRRTDSIPEASRGRQVGKLLVFSQAPRYRDDGPP